jgi:DNA-binding NarL/FixJ family response regulator
VAGINRVKLTAFLAVKAAMERYGKRTLTKREQEVVELVAQGLKNSQVAEIIGTTEWVVKNHLRAIYDKLGIWSRLELCLWQEARRHEDASPHSDPPNASKSQKARAQHASGRH